MLKAIYLTRKGKINQNIKLNPKKSLKSSHPYAIKHFCISNAKYTSKKPTKQKKKYISTISQMSLIFCEHKTHPGFFKAFWYLFMFFCFSFKFVSDAENWFCECPKLYSGKLCQFATCEENPCGNGATCFPKSRRDAVCLCPYGRSGILCSDGKNHFLYT